jgi:hypothetical protein
MKTIIDGILVAIILTTFVLASAYFLTYLICCAARLCGMNIPLPQ